MTQRIETQILRQGEPICDFCAGKPVTWRYPCASHDNATFPAEIFGVPVTTGSISDWAACDACHALIESNDRDALAQRSLDSAASVPGLDIPHDVHVVRDVQTR